MSFGRVRTGPDRRPEFPHGMFRVPRGHGFEAPADREQDARIRGVPVFLLSLLAGHDFELFRRLFPLPLSKKNAPEVVMDPRVTWVEMKSGPVFHDGVVQVVRFRQRRAQPIVNLCLLGPKLGRRS